MKKFKFNLLFCVIVLVMKFLFTCYLYYMNNWHRTIMNLTWWVKFLGWLSQLIILIFSNLYYCIFCKVNFLFVGSVSFVRLFYFFLKKRQSVMCTILEEHINEIEFDFSILAILNFLGISENLYTVITKVDDYQQAFRRNTDSTWPVEFTGTRSLKEIYRQHCKLKLNH